MQIVELFKRYKESSFARSVGVLVGGTAVAQGLMFLILPLLTRLYTPSDFNILSIYLAMLSVISVAATLRFELAIPIPEDDGEAVNIVALAIVSSAIIALVTGVIVWTVPSAISTLFKQPGLGPYLWLLPFGVFLTGTYSALQFWAGRKKRFTAIAKTKVHQAFGAAATQVLLGWASGGPVGLILGQTINNGAGAVGLTISTRVSDRALFKRLSGVEMKHLFKKYSRFPKFSSLEALANNAAIQVPVMIIAALAIGPEAGYLLLAMQVMQAPIGLLGGAVSQVYLSKAPEMQRQGELANFTSQTLEGLIKVGVIPLVFVGLVAPLVFPVVFGEQWQRTGLIVSYMIPWVVMQLLASPVSMVLHITNNQKLALIIQLSGLILRVGAVIAAASFFANRLTEIYAVTGFIFYLIYLIVVMKVAKVNVQSLVYRSRHVVGAAVLITALSGVLVFYISSR